MEKAQVLFFVTLGVYILAVIFFLCGFGGPNWQEADGDYYSYNSGLWKACLNDECDTLKLDKQKDWFKATAAFMILAFLAMIAAGVTFLWLPITAMCHCLTGGLTLLAIIIYGAKYNDDDLDLGWSFALATLSALIFLANGGVMAFFALSSSCDMTRRPIPFIESDKPQPTI